MRPETIRRLLVVAVCALGVMMLHLWPTDAQSPSGHPREQAPTDVTPGSPSPEPEPSPTTSTPTQPSIPPWNPDERWDTNSPEPPGSTPPSSPPTSPPTSPSAPTSPPSSGPSEPPSTPPTSPSPSDPPTSPTPTPTPTDPPTSDPPDEDLALPDEIDIDGDPDTGFNVRWERCPGATKYYVFVDDEDEPLTVVEPTSPVPPGAEKVTIIAANDEDEGEPKTYKLTTDEVGPSESPSASRPPAGATPGTPPPSSPPPTSPPSKETPG